MSRIHRLAALFALATAAACADAPGAFGPVSLPQPEPPLAALQCTVTVARGDMRCGAGTPGGVMGDLLIGGQGTYVQLRSANGRYDSLTQVFTLDVTMQNLLGQPVGTEDGTTPTGIRIFFHTPPAASAGSGTIEVKNPDGTGIFTEAGQPYFEYPEVLAAYERTAPRPWEWNVPLGVESFHFAVYVSARVPNEQGVLRWTREQGDVVSRDVFTVWGTGPNDIWAAGSGVMMYNNGTRWVVIPGDWKGVAEIHGSGTNDVWAVGGGYGEIHHFDGRRWSLVPALNENWSNVWAQSPANAYVVGGAWGNVIRWNGSGWDTVFPAVDRRRFWDVWGFAANDVYLTGGWWNTAAQRYDNFMWHWNGTAWDSTAFEPGTGVGTLWGTSPTNLYGLGGGGVMRYDGTSWTQVATTPYGLREIWGSGPDDVWAVGGGYHNGGPEGTVLHYDGVSWSEVQTGAPATVAGVYAPNPDKVYLVGYRGMIHKRSGGQWVAETSARQDYIGGLATVSETDVITAQCGGLRRNTGPGGGWQTLYATDDCLEKVWTTPGASQIFAVGNGTGQWGMRQGVIVRWDGAQWTRTVLPNVSYLHGVWGLDSTHVYAVGYGDEMGQQVPRLFRWDGSTWSEIDTGQPSGQLFGVWGTSPDDLWVVGHMVLHWDGVRWDRKFVHEWSDGWTDVWGTGPDNVFLAGGRVARWDGTRWSSIYPRLNYQGSGVWGSGPSDVYVVGSQTLHWNGTSWTEVNIETGSSLADIGGVNGRHVWAVGAGGAIMRGRR
ncbi:MAG TPA: hypothetical protein VHG93_23120 [Longimicrobium sp.]|nr:hypothetical protein [Longimicrobium sp.]